jgi:hypothetical protein
MTRRTHLIRTPDITTDQIDHPVTDLEGAFR